MGYISKRSRNLPDLRRMGNHRVSYRHKNVTLYVAPYSAEIEKELRRIVVEFNAENRRRWEKSEREKIYGRRLGGFV